MIELRGNSSRTPPAFLPSAVLEENQIEVPESVQVIRTLGQGRAARAQLVEATMPGGRRVTCVEKVFAPGLLTRLIYRLSFQSPFAYQSNEHAIRACFYRRRVASAVFAASDLEVGIAAPLYVRFDSQQRAWVLAAEWIDGRGIKPAPPDATRLARRFQRLTGKADPQSEKAVAEIDQLVGLMGQLERLLAECGLVGSGWQVAPRAMVSTANLLRVGERYTVIDLESGIPAVLVGKYLLSGLRRSELPPFDDLDAARLRSWLRDNQHLLTFRLGPQAAEELSRDAELLITHTDHWKNSEWAWFRRPWRHLTRGGMAAYQAECLRRWRQDGVIDKATESTLAERPIKARLIWWSGLLPSKLGTCCSKWIGNRDFRERVEQWLRDPETRRARWQRTLLDHQTRWIEAGRLPETTTLTAATFWFHGGVRKLTTPRIHRLLIDRNQRSELWLKLLLILCCPRYQSWLGWRRVESAIQRWHTSQRITTEQADQLRDDLCGHEVRAYTRGFAGHLALKTLAPVILPAKVGGVAAFLASGNLWFLLPMLSTPVLRTAITMASAWSTRHRGIPHGEALATGWLPVVGSVAFPLQMFSSRPDLSTFLIRDTASKLGRRLPIYGGADSRTEMAMIRATDGLIEVMEIIAGRLRRVFRKNRTSANERVAEPLIASLPRTRVGRWLDRKAREQIERQSVAMPNERSEERIAA